MNETVEPQQVPCKVCGKPAPKFGRYAGRCDLHRNERIEAAEEHNMEQPRSNGAQPLSREVRHLLLDLVLLDGIDLDQLRLDAARILLTEEKP